jgi:EAL domain-containing protein (putative c-di-GMP-specific phosphodiesterase class I)
VALHTARHIEKKPYVFCSEKIKERIYTEKKFVTDFDRAIKRGEFKAYYQPKVNTADYTIVGAEALVRWDCEDRIILPGEFVPIYERNGMICQLDFYVFEQVCKDIRDWLDRGIEPVRISMNFSRKHLSNPNLPDDIMSILEKYNVDSKYIEIELTETVDEEETEKIVCFMKEMKKRNVSMSVDDFGTGYSSLNLLRSFPVDVLKIDKSFIDTQEETDKIVLSNIIRMANQLCMNVVAEGVETVGQMEYLLQMNCNVVQGYLFDKPMQRELFEQRLLAGKYNLEK